MSGLAAGLDPAAAQAEQSLAAACMRMLSVPAARWAHPVRPPAALGPGALKQAAVPRRTLLLPISTGWAVSRAGT